MKDFMKSVGRAVSFVLPGITVLAVGRQFRMLAFVPRSPAEVLQPGFTNTTGRFSDHFSNVSYIDAPLGTLDVTHSNAANKLLSHTMLQSSVPLQLLEEYILWHSNEALIHRESSLHNQTFVVGLYACPDSAGNRLHEFFNAMIQAVAYNFTILVKFYDLHTCLQTQLRRPSEWCTSVNTPELCNKMVQRASWLPLYDDWEEMLNLTLGKRGQQLSFVANITGQNTVWIPEECVAPVALKHYQKRLQRTDVLKRFEQLYSLGSGYLYGMLFRHLFPFHPGILPEFLPVTTDDTISIALHSRHFDSRHNGSNIDDEIHCLDTVIDQLQTTRVGNLPNCSIFVMSDRNLTIEGIKQYAKVKGCSTVVAEHQEDEGMTTEHGPFALKGFFQDLGLVQYAQSGFVGHCGSSTSSDLVRELIEYNHISSHRNRQEALPICCLAKKKLGNTG